MNWCYSSALWLRSAVGKMDVEVRIGIGVVCYSDFQSCCDTMMLIADVSALQS